MGDIHENTALHYSEKRKVTKIQLKTIQRKGTKYLMRLSILQRTEQT